MTDGYHLWSERFDRDLNDIFAVQDEISLAIVDQLHVNLVGADKEVLVKRSTERMELHNLHLLGMYHLHRFTLEDTRRSREHFEKAIELDPSYAPAYAGLAWVHHMYAGGGLNIEPPLDAMPKVKRAAERAIDLDPSNSNAHTALALAGIFHERDWPMVLHHVQKALELDPNASWAHLCYAQYLSVAERFDEAITTIERGITLDPLAPVMLQNAAYHHYMARNSERAREYCKKTCELAPDFVWLHFVEGLLDVQAGRLNDAKSAFERDGCGFMEGYIGYAHGAMGDREKAQQLLEQVQTHIASGKGSAYSSALIHFGLGDTDQCLGALEASAAERPAILSVSAWLNVDPFWDPLRDNPRFQDLLRRINFPE